MVANIEQIIPIVVAVTFVILMVSLILRIFKQPYVVAYIIAGVVLGIFGVIEDKSQLSFLGEIGVMLLMFFIGMEIYLPKLISKWRIVMLGPIFQIVFSIGAMLLFGEFLGWSWEKCILIGFIITLSSTAVIIKILEDLDELQSKIGQKVLGILIVQDIAAVPMMVIIGILGGKNIDSTGMIMKIIGALIIGILLYLILSKKIKIPLPRKLVESKESQVFMALIICFGLAALTSFFGLSAALGAFFGGIIVASYRGTEWAQKNLHPFKVVFVAMFFVYIGIMIDLDFIRDNIIIIAILVLFVFIINTLINTLILRFLGTKIKESFYAGSLLAQIGEFSFLIGAAGLSAGLIQLEEYNLIISVISITLLLSPVWITFIKKSLGINANFIFEDFTKHFEMTTVIKYYDKEDNLERKNGKKTNKKERNLEKY